MASNIGQENAKRCSLWLGFKPKCQRAIVTATIAQASMLNLCAYVFASTFMKMIHISRQALVLGFSLISKITFKLPYIAYS